MDEFEYSGENPATMADEFTEEEMIDRVDEEIKEEVDE